MDHTPDKLATLSFEEKQDLLLETFVKDLEKTFALLGHMFLQPSPALDEYRFLRSQYNAVLKNDMLGMDTPDVIRVEKTRIRRALLNLINNLEPKYLERGEPGTEEVAVQSIAPTKGSIWKNIPPVMTLNDAVECQIRIALDEKLFDWKPQGPETAVRVEALRVSDLMEVTLLNPFQDDPNFSISSITDDRQFLDEDTFTEWLFYVKPLKEGKHKLILKVDIIEEKNGEKEIRNFTLREEIEIVTTPMEDQVEAGFKRVAALNFFPVVTAGAFEDRDEEADQTDDQSSENKARQQQTQPTESASTEPIINKGKKTLAVAAIVILTLGMLGYGLYNSYEDLSDTPTPHDNPVANKEPWPAPSDTINSQDNWKNSTRIRISFPKSINKDSFQLEVPEQVSGWKISKEDNQSTPQYYITPPSLKERDSVSLEYQICRIKEPTNCHDTSSTITIVVIPRLRPELKNDISRNFPAGGKINIGINSLVNNWDTLSKIKHYRSPTINITEWQPDKTNGIKVDTLNDEVLLTARKTGEYSIPYKVCFQDGINQDTVCSAIGSIILNVGQKPAPVYPDPDPVKGPDSLLYPIVEINDKLWTKKNLRFDVTSGKIDSWCRQNGDCQQYGRYYNWSSADAACKALDDGTWRLPTRQEWEAIFNRRKVTKLALEMSGEMTGDGSIQGPGSTAYFWTADPDSDNYYYAMLYIDGSTPEYPRARSKSRYACRCVKRK